MYSVNLFNKAFQLKTTLFIVCVFSFSDGDHFYFSCDICTRRIRSDPSFSAQPESLRRNPLVIAYFHLQKMFQHCVTQVILQNNLITDLETRLSRTDEDYCRTFSYPLRMHLMTAQRVRDMFMEYLNRRLNNIEAIERKMTESGIVLLL